MTYRQRITLTCLALAIICVTSGCFSPAQRSLSQAPVEKFSLEPRNVTFTRIEIVDARKAEDLLPLKPSCRYFVPALLWWQAAFEGQLRPEAKLYSVDVPSEMQHLVRKALAETKAVGPQGGDAHLTLKVELTHLYGVTHSSFLFMASLGAAATMNRTFAPYGFAAARITVAREDGSVLGRRDVSGYFSPNFEDAVACAPGGPDNASPYVVTDCLSAAAVAAAGNLAGNIAKALDPMLAGYVLKPAPAPEKRASFVLARATGDGLHLEIAVVNYQDGQILSDTVVRRWMEPFSAVDEWVVDPYQAGNRMLTREEYAALVSHLQQKYAVSYVTDVRVAHFFGLKNGTSKIGRTSCIFAGAAASGKGG